jgi:hypothetical protein
MRPFDAVIATRNVARQDADIGTVVDRAAVVQEVEVPKLQVKISEDKGAHEDQR